MTQETTTTTTRTTTTSPAQTTSSPLSSSSAPASLRWLSSYSTVSSLQRQYQYEEESCKGRGDRKTSSSNRILLFVHANAQCCLPGGVDALLKAASAQKDAKSTTKDLNPSEADGKEKESASSSSLSNKVAKATATAAAAASVVDPFAVLREDEILFGSGVGYALPPPPTTTTNSTNDGTVVDEESNNDMTSNESEPKDSPRASAPVATAASRAGGGGGGGWGRSLWKSVGRTLDKGLHKLAIRADQGRHPDLVTVALYEVVRGQRTGILTRTSVAEEDAKDQNADDNEPGYQEETILLCATEPQPWPRSTKKDNDNHNEHGGGGGGVWFHLPLVVPRHWEQMADDGDDDDIPLILRLWIRSGATLLTSTTGSSNFLLGSCRTSVKELRRAMTTATVAGQMTTMITVSETSSLVSETNGILSVPPIDESIQTASSSSSSKLVGEEKDDEQDNGDGIHEKKGDEENHKNDVDDEHVSSQDANGSTGSHGADGPSDIVTNAAENGRHSGTLANVKQGDQIREEFRPTILEWDLLSPVLSSLSTAAATRTTDSDAKLTICLIPDFKYSKQSKIVIDGAASAKCRLTRDGGSLVDPDITSYSDPRQFYNRPLDQTFAFPFRNKSFLLATQRVTETTVALPLATAYAQLVSKACHTSLAHAETTASLVLSQRHDAAVGEYADCQIGIGYVHMANLLPEGGSERPHVAVSWQRPDSVFEVELLPSCTLPIGPGEAGFIAAQTIRFFPKPCKDNVLPSVLQQLDGRLPPCGFLLGSLRVRIVMMTPAVTGPTSPKRNKSKGREIKRADCLNDDPNVPPAGAVDDSNSAISQGDFETYECCIALEEILLRRRGADPVKEYSVYNTKTGREMAVVGLSITVSMNQGPEAPKQPSSANNGLVSLVGMSLGGCYTPCLDFDVDECDQERKQRIQKLRTLGGFVAHAYIDQHASEIREHDTELLNGRATFYKASLEQTIEYDENGDQNQKERCLPFKGKVPRSFRPSSSRLKMFLSGLPLNLHTNSWSFNVVDTSSEENLIEEVYYLTTCGVPTHPARGFGNIFDMEKYLRKYRVEEEDDDEAKQNRAALTAMKCPLGSVSGGLRRMEARRDELINHVIGLQEHVEAAVDLFLQSRRDSGQLVTHAPAAQFDVQGMRWKVFQTIQALHHVTWTCAMRRATVFSQTLCVAVSTYLTSLSDPEIVQSAWPEVWVKHGFLISFESLLCAVGKELGMMEDASVGVDMLKMVHINLVSSESEGNDGDRFAIPGSSRLKWLKLATAGQNADRVFTVSLGVDPTYLQEQIPASLRNNASVRLVPLIFAVDVYRRASQNLSNEKKENFIWSGLVDDEDDDDVVVEHDETVPVQLNKFAFHQLNSYAKVASPTSADSGSPDEIHPSLKELLQRMDACSGMIVHESILEASRRVRELGGTSVVCCKTGKDRSAMHLTFQQAKVLDEFSSRFAPPATPPPPPPEDDAFNDVINVDGDKQPSQLKKEKPTAEKGGPKYNENFTRLLRLHGTPLPLCEKNTGQALFAFTSRQVKALPPQLQPPVDVLLKRGLFTRKSET